MIMSDNEIYYQITMYLIKKLLSDHVITAEEYNEIDTYFTQKYKPIFGTLFSDPSLTSAWKRVIYNSKEDWYYEENQ